MYDIGMNPKVIAIGDIHGHHTEMCELMYKLFGRDDIDPNTDIFVFLGDYVDGGPDTKKVLDTMIKWKEQFPHWKFLFGNHESLMLDAFNPKHPIYGSYDLWAGQGGYETINSFKPPLSENPTEEEQYQYSIMQPEDLITEPYLDFIRNLDLYYETDEYFFVHGGLYPNRSIEDHIEAVKKDYPSSFHPALMSEGDMAYDMIWMRRPFLDSHYDWGKKIIFGHTVYPRGVILGNDPDTMLKTNKIGYPLIMDNKIGIDTMPFNTGRLTALILPDEEFVFTDFV